MTHRNGDFQLASFEPSHWSAPANWTLTCIGGGCTIAADVDRRFEGSQAMRLQKNGAGTLTAVHGQNVDISAFGGIVYDAAGLGNAAVSFWVYKHSVTPFGWRPGSSGFTLELTTDESTGFITAPVTGSNIGVDVAAQPVGTARRYTYRLAVGQPEQFGRTVTALLGTRLDLTSFIGDPPPVGFNVTIDDLRLTRWIPPGVAGGSWGPLGAAAGTWTALAPTTRVWTVLP